MSQIGQYLLTGFVPAVTWNFIPGNTVNIDPGNGYVLENAGLTTALLPAACTAGMIIRIVDVGGLFIIDQNAGQSIDFGNTSSTPGVLGSVASTMQFDALELLCIVDNTEFVVLSSVGNFTVA